jgi:FecR protein.
VVLVAALLVVGSGYYFFVVQAQAAVAAPAALAVINQPVDVDGNPGIPGEALNPGNTVHTGTGGHAAIQFPDGSYVRMSPDTSVTLTAVQLQKNGNLQSASVIQKVGRTLTSVQHLATGASFQVGGHSVSAQVRGTEFEVLVRSNGTNLIKVRRHGHRERCHDGQAHGWPADRRGRERTALQPAADPAGCPGPVSAHLAMLQGRVERQQLRHHAVVER